MNGDDMSALQIKSWCDLTDTSMENWELRAIMAITRELEKSRS